MPSLLKLSFAILAACPRTWTPGPFFQRMGGSDPIPKQSLSPSFFRAPQTGPVVSTRLLRVPSVSSAWSAWADDLASSTPVPVGSPPSIPAYLGPCSAAGCSPRLLLSSCDSTQCPCNHNYLPRVLPLLGVEVSDNFL